MRYLVEITTKSGMKVLWMNGGVGYSEDELKEVIRKLKNDKRVIDHRVIAKR